MALTFPDIRVRRQQFTPAAAAQTGGRSTSGSEQVIESGSGYWEALIDVLVGSHDDVLAWDAFLADMGGIFNTANIPYDQWKRAPWPINEYGITLTPWSVRNRHLDGTPYEEPEIPTVSAITATVSGAVVLGATQIAVNVSQGSALVRGHKFSVANKMYQIAEIVGTSGTIYTCRVWPEVRLGISSGAAVEIPTPKCEMRFDDNQQGALADDGLGYGVVTVKFREAV